MDLLTKQNKGRGLVDRKLVEVHQSPPPPPPQKKKNALLVVPRWLFRFSSLVSLDVARCYLWLFLLYINIKIGKNKLAGDHPYGKMLFTWLSLVMSMMVSFCAVLFPTRCLG